MMKKYSWLLIVFCMIVCNHLNAQQLPPYNLKALSQTHNITAPAWGPYSKIYAGISHIADNNLGARFDITVAAGFFKGKVIVPNVTYVSGYHPWDASADLEYYSFREEIEWKDKIYADISFAPYNRNARLIQIELVNNTSTLQNLSLNLLASLQYDNAPVKVKLPAGRKWENAIKYATLTYKKPRPDDNLRADAMLKGESRNNDFTDGFGLADNFGKDAGDKVSYNITNQTSLQNGCLLIRYRIAKNKRAILKATGFFVGDIELNGTGDFVQKVIPMGKINKGQSVLEFITQSNTPIELDGFCILEEAEVMLVKFIPFLKNIKPLTDDTSLKQSIILKYPSLQHYYGICWSTNVAANIREVNIDDYANAIKGDTEFVNKQNYAVHKNATTSNVYLKSFNIQPNSKQEIYVILCEGNKEDLVSQMQSFLKDKSLATVFLKKTDNKKNFNYINPEGKKFLFSQDRMKATMLTNIVYPLYAQQQIIKQFVPGKRWNSLYTWDGGFIGLGMLEIDLQRAIEALNGYTNPSTEANAYIQHGSLVPVQFIIYQDIWNRTQSKELLQYFYNRLKNYYLFYTGQYGSSTTRKLKSGLLNTFDYFYNSGGWDDYPAQSFANKSKMYNWVAPVVNTSWAIRIAKIMQASAGILGIEKDKQLYQNDMDIFTKAIQQYSWDEASGYFGYVVHDPETLLPTGILRNKDGVNYNMGLDGIYPLVAGICTPHQKEKALEHLFSSSQCWTPFGITVVDQSAPYYSANGYWNGTVWFPHQYIFWKTLLDMGEGKHAAQIAQTALNLYKNEMDSTYNSFELVRLNTGHISGWHQFSGLSAPVLNWFAAYYRPGTINVGYDGWIMDKSFRDDYTSLTAKVKFSTKEKRAGILICMKSGKFYSVRIDGKIVHYDETVPGSLYVNVKVNENQLVKIDVKAEK